MLLTLTTTRRPATDLGWLLHKRPGKTQVFPLNFGVAHVFWPEVSDERATAALCLELDPIGLVRREGGADPLEDYVNDRPYVASSFLAVAIAEVFGTALSGRCTGRPELVDIPLPLEVRLAVLPCRGGERVLRACFEPLGYAVEATFHPLDATRPEWGASPYATVTLRATLPLASCLRHLTVLVPVLDDDKHYWVAEDEVEKLLRRGDGWLSAHPERELIAARYLKHQRRLARAALARLAEGAPDPDAAAEASDVAEAEVERPLALRDQRIGAVCAALRAAGASRVLDLGCGEGALLRPLLDDAAFTAVAGMDVSPRVLERAAERLHLDRMPERRRARLTLFQGSCVYRDPRLAGYDAAVAMEVIEHLDPWRLEAFARVVLEAARPGTLVLTTPNAEYNVRFPGLPAGRFRHADHRFEWTRAELRAWAEGVAGRFGYAVRFLPVGPEDPAVGAPTQMAIFTRGGTPAAPSAEAETT